MVVVVADGRGSGRGSRDCIVFSKAWKGEEVLDECFICRSVVLRRF